MCVCVGGANNRRISITVNEITQREVQCHVGKKESGGEERGRDRWPDRQTGFNQDSLYMCTCISVHVCAHVCMLVNMHVCAHPCLKFCLCL